MPDLLKNIFSLFKSFRYFSEESVFLCGCFFLCFYLISLIRNSFYLSYHRDFVSAVI